MFNKRQKLAELEIHQRKLTELVSGLLGQADELDHESQERQAKLTPQWHDSFAQTCREIVSLSETVNSIATLLKKGDVKACEQALLRSIEIAKHLSGRLQELRATSNK